jgi:hypothetical protein
VQQAALAYARRHLIQSCLGVLALCLLAWGAFAPLGAIERSHVIDIADGTLQRRLAGDIQGALPPTVRLTLAVHDVLHVKNHDSVPHYLGAVLVRPGREFRLPFEAASQREFTSSFHFGGKLTVVVEPWPVPGTARLRWRVLALEQAIRHY